MSLLSLLIPKEEEFFGLLDKAGANAQKSVETFNKLMHNWNEKSDLFQSIRNIENEGDMLTHETIDRLNRTFVTPIDREDIYKLSGQIDDICDILQALSDRMQLYDLGQVIPETMLKMSELLVKGGELVAAAVKEFHNFRRNSRVSDYCIKIKHIENEADDLLKFALAGLFKHHEVLPLIKWKEIYESIERAHDKLSEIANTLEGIIVKNA